LYIVTYHCVSLFTYDAGKLARPQPRRVASELTSILGELQRRYREPAIVEERQGRAWLLEEDQTLRKAYLAGMSISDLAQHHLRSRQAIRKRLIRLGLLEPERGTINAHSIIRTAGGVSSICAWTYLLLSERGEVYLGATTHLRQRIRSHNSRESTQWTRGRRWHLLAVRGFANRKEAFAFELELKKQPHKKEKWKVQSNERANKIASRYGYEFPSQRWPTK
jgi:predicted GIY-YIG superfamily endonuclease